MTAPFAKQISDYLGLNVEPVSDKAKEYWVLSPTKKRLFRIGSFGDGTEIGMVSTPDMFSLSGRENVR